MRTATFALLFGIAYVSAGLLGLNPAALMAPPAHAPPLHFTVLYGYLLGLFPVNVLHTAVHLAIGAWGILAWRGLASPRHQQLFGLLPLHGHDVWLHAGTAALAVYFWRTEVLVERRANPIPDRREQMLPVGRERRFRQNDRRLPGSEV